ncbi:NAD-dependent epimerase/dehydratase family protein [Thermodesulfobacteriota bacterium]
MTKDKQIACVTGASGMIGSKIVRQLLSGGYRVRVLTRDQAENDLDVDVYHGGLDDEKILPAFVNDADILFHAAAELRNEHKMWEVNVLGTKRLLNFVKKSNIRYFCYLSSAGVVGLTQRKWVDEEVECNPQNTYEESKWAAEQMIVSGIDDCQTVILRPTNVVDEEYPGALNLPMSRSWKNRFTVFLKGGECAHIVHAEDVAAAAMHFVSHSDDTCRSFFVSCDHEPLNTFAGLWSLYIAAMNNRPLEPVRPIPHLPLIVPYILRKIWRGSGNRGDVRYSSEKLISEGFKFPLGLRESIRRIASTRDIRRS